jgi:NADH pyrophosphatase NudC (nudix superfamily)
MNGGLDGFPLSSGGKVSFIPGVDPPAARFPEGFLDAGETLEECVEREVKEEVRIHIKGLRYFASQPWPFPNSLMAAFTAEYASGEIAIDGSEIEEADWYSPKDIPRRIPDKASVARRLIDWFAAEYGGGVADQAPAKGGKA